MYWVVAGDFNQMANHSDIFDTDAHLPITAAFSFMKTS